VGIKLLELYKKNNIIFFEIENKIFKAKVTTKVENQFTVYIYNFNKSFNINLGNKFLPAKKTSIEEKGFDRQLESPLSGRIIKINVKEGELVTKNQTLVVIESMKMENEIKAKNDAFIKTIPIIKGDLIKPNQILMTFEKKGEKNATVKIQNEQETIPNR